MGCRGLFLPEQWLRQPDGTASPSLTQWPTWSCVSGWSGPRPSGVSVILRWEESCFLCHYAMRLVLWSGLEDSSLTKSCGGDLSIALGRACYSPKKVAEGAT